MSAIHQSIIFSSSKLRLAHGSFRVSVRDRRAWSSRDGMRWVDPQKLSRPEGRPKVARRARGSKTGEGGSNLGSAALEQAVGNEEATKSGVTMIFLGITWREGSGVALCL